MALKAVLQAIEYYLPETIEDNQFLVDTLSLDWTAKDIYQKTGIHQRHIARPDECASDLGQKAAEGLFNRFPILRNQIDYVLFCSQSGDFFLPATACLLQTRLHLSKQCGAVDMAQGCSGFIYGLSFAKGLIESGAAHDVLLITAETYSHYLAPEDKATRTIFGDGAAAIWVKKAELNVEPIRNFVFGTNGEGAENLIVRAGGSRYPKMRISDGYLFMDGPEIFQFTLRVVPKTIKKILSKENASFEDVDYFIFHQANAFILEHLREKMGIAKERFCIDMVDTGNTVSASIPIALHRAELAGKIHQGMRVMLLGFGVGYSWGGCIIEIQ